MKFILIVALIFTSWFANAQTVTGARPINSKPPAFLPLSEKMKNLPPGHPATKLSASGISFFLSAEKIKHNDKNYLELEKPNYLYPHQVSFNQNTSKDGYGGPTIFFVTNNDQSSVCLFEINTWLPKGSGEEEFRIHNGKDIEVVKVNMSGSASFQEKKVIFALTIPKGLNKVRMYSTKSFWNMLNCHITYLK